jgi:anti-sigma factor RsiW
MSNADIPRDAELTAFIDGALSPVDREALAKRIAADAELAARLEELRSGGRDFRSAFEVLLAAAPTERLDEILAGATQAASRPFMERRAPDRGRMAFRIAAGFLLFVAGISLGVLLPRVLGSAPTEVAERGPANWRSAVAEYLTLYTRDSLAGIPDDAAMRSAELDQAGTRLALGLTPDKVALPGLALKRAQLFEFNGKPLAQIAYLGADDGPVAFCIIVNGAADAAPKFEEREGQNIVFWSKGGRGYLIIGRTPRQNLEALATHLQQAIS